MSAPHTSEPHPAGPASPLQQVADTALQRVADASIWVLFRVTGVRS